MAMYDLGMDTELMEHTTSDTAKIKVAQLAEAVLCPREYNNSLFWTCIYELNLEDSIDKALDTVDFRCGTDHSVFYRSTYDDSVDFYACWPDIDELMQALKEHLSSKDFQFVTTVIDTCRLDDANMQYSGGLMHNRAPTTPSCASVALQVLGGFIAVLGATAIAVAFAVLNAATLGTAGVLTAATGAALTLSGYGLFKVAKNQTENTSPLTASTPALTCH